MQAAASDSGDHIVRINPAPCGSPRNAQDTKGADRKHLPQAEPPAYLRSLLPSQVDTSLPSARPLTDRPRQALRPPEPVVGTVASHEVRSDSSWLPSVVRHGVILISGAVVWSTTALAEREQDPGASGPVTAGVLTSAVLYLASYAGPRLRDAWAARQERNRIVSERLNPGQQLARVVELANAQPLTTEGLRHAVARIVELGTLHPHTLPPPKIADAIAQLGGWAVDLPLSEQDNAPGHAARFELLCQAFLDLRAQQGLAAADGARALQALLGHVDTLAYGMPPAVRQHVLDQSIQTLERLREGPGGLSDAEHATHLSALSKVAFLRGAQTETAVWQALLHGLPGEGQPPVDVLIARVASVRPVYEWLLDRTADEIARRQGDALHRDLSALRTYQDLIVRLAGALAPALPPQGLRHLVLELLWAPWLRELPGGRAEALARMPALSAALRWHLDEARTRALVDCLLDTEFFNAEPANDSASQQLAALVGPQTPITSRLAILEAATKIEGPQAAWRMRDQLAPVTLASVLQRMPAALLARETAAALQHLGETKSLPRTYLQVMDTLAGRDDAPAGAVLAGLATPAQVTRMIKDLADAPLAPHNRDRAKVIARLPQLCQASATRHLVEYAVRTLRGLPEFAPQGGAHGDQDRRRQQGLLACVKAACESAGTFITSEDERLARARDATGLAPVAQDFESAPGLRTAAPRATIDHAWLTPAFIERMMAPPQAVTERKSASSSSSSRDA